MKYVTYILRSTSSGRYYIGSTASLKRRLREHNSGKTFSTRKRGPWEIVHFEEFMSKGEAISRELQIKRYKGGKAFKKLLESA